MRAKRSLALLSLAIALTINAVGFSADDRQPFAWQFASPESQGVSGPKLEAIRKDLAARRTRAFLVVRHDKIVYEWYAAGVKPDAKQGTASLAKAAIGGLSLAVAITDGRTRLDDTAVKYIPEWKSDVHKSRITIRQLGSHTSGLADSTTAGVRNENQPGWRGDFWKRLPPPRDPFTISRDQVPLLFEAGERMHYSNPGIAMLNYCVTAAIREGEQRDIRSLVRERVMRPIGVNDGDWSAGYGQTIIVNDLPLVGAWGGANFTPRALVRVGRLVLREGDWDGRQLLSRDAIRDVTHDAGFSGHCGMGWWTNNGRRYPWLPTDAVWGAGAGDQLLLVVPSLNLIMVRNGDVLHTAAEINGLRPKDVFEEFHDPRAELLFKPLVEAVAR
jgi:CubicO group peptidase (beta-lactamase class C family)